MDLRWERICRRLGVEDLRYVEIESKKRVLPASVKPLRKFLLSHRKVRHQKAAFFFDQFLDTPSMDLFRLGASLRLRYKRNGSAVYLQYKGPGFVRAGLLYRSEFSSDKLSHLLMEESHHDIIRFSATSIGELLRQHMEPPMALAMRRHLGSRVLSRITTGPILSIYQKDKFLVDLGSAYLEPSLDRVCAFHVNPRGVHPLSTFWEYENEIKASGKRAAGKLEHVDDLVAFDARLAERFELRPEALDKYHRCASFFLPRGRRRRTRRQRR